MPGENGFPAIDPTVPFFNHGLQVTGLDGEDRHLRIRDLAFRSFVVGVGLLPDVAFATSTCEGITSTDGRLDRSRIDKNFFTDNFDGLRIQGDIERPRIQGNVARGNRARSVFLRGGGEGCVNQDGTGGVVLYGRPTESRLQNNALNNVVSIGTQSTMVHGNRLVQDGAVPVVMVSSRDVSVRDNEILSSLSIVLFDVLRGEIEANRLVDSRLGMVFDGETSEVLVKDNQFDRTSVVFDIGLFPDTFDRRIIVGPDAVVDDQGTNNEVLVEHE